MRNLRTKVRIPMRTIEYQMSLPEPDYLIIGHAAIEIAEFCSPEVERKRKRCDKLFADFIQERTVPTYAVKPSNSRGGGSNGI